MSGAGIQYVQPVQVVPVGQPIPAVQAGANSGAYQYTVPVTQGVDRDYQVNAYKKPAVAQSGSSGSFTNRDYQASSYNDPTISYGAPLTSSQPSHSYNNPIKSYKGPKSTFQTNYASSSTGHQAADKIDTIDLYQTNFQVEQSNSQVSQEQKRPERSGRQDECYCVPVAQCPADKILGNTPTKDYSSLINPRVKNPNIDIVAPSGRSDLESITEAVDEDETTTEAVTEAVTELTRKRRQNEETEPIPMSSRLGNEFVAEQVAATSRLNNDDLDLSDEEAKLLEKIKQKKKELRQKERKEKLKNESQNNKDSSKNEDDSVEDLESEDKSFDSLASFTGDVTNKVGSVGDSVKSGVSVSI